MLNGYQTLGGGLHNEDDGGGNLLPGEIEGVGKMPGLHGRVGVGAAIGTLPGA